MYGYVRPERGELRVREYEQFRGVYCGLCHTLAARYGPALRFAVNYDFTFLAMLLAGPDEPEPCARRCPYRPTRKTVCPGPSPAMDAAADYTVVLAYWKLRDGAADGRFFPALGSRLLAAAIGPAYRKAASRRPAFARETEQSLAALAALESGKCASLDAAADTFARILAAAAESAGDKPRPEAGDSAGDPPRVRAVRELLYHLGRVVYVLDAADDLADDAAADAYNPLRYRFDTKDGRLSPEDEAGLRVTLSHSHNSIISAFQLLDGTPYTAILENIIYLGLPAAAQAVFSGTWRAGRRPGREERSRL